MARPRKAETERRTRSIAVRLTPSERSVLEAEAVARRISASELLRAAFFAARDGTSSTLRMPANPPILDASAVVALNRVGANLNQLARRANAGDLLQPGELPIALADLSVQLDRIEALVMTEIDR